MQAQELKTVLIELKAVEIQPSDFVLVIPIRWLARMRTSVGVVCRPVINRALPTYNNYSVTPAGDEGPGARCIATDNPDPEII